MYRILCFGDSNTWGYNPRTGLRFPERDRWPAVLRIDLGDGFEIVENGLNGRRFLDGTGELESLMHEHRHFDVILIYLGINDICFDRDTAPGEIAAAAEALLKSVAGHFAELDGASPDVILIGPPPVNEVQVRDCFYEQEAEKAVRLCEELRALAGRSGAGFIDAGRIIETSPLDGIHLEEAAHRKLGLFVADYLRSFLKNTNLNSNRR